MNLAIVTPDMSYSTTFIQAHKRIPAEKILFYYGGTIPIYLENFGVVTPSRYELSLKNTFRLLKSFNPIAKVRGKLSLKEHFFAESLKKNKADAVLAEYGITGVACMNICKALHIPLIVHFHGYDVYKADSNLIDRYRQLFKTASRLVVVSREMGERLVEWGADPAKIVYTPCGPNEMFYTTEPDRESKTFVAVGRFVEKKAPQLTLKAFKETLATHPDAKLVMIGDGPLLNECKALVESWGLQESIQLPGQKSPEEIKEYHSRSCAYVQHSVEAASGDREGTPVGVMEAMASSLPVIATRHAGIKDVVVEEETGLLCDEKDYRAMSANMNFILENPEAAMAMGKKGRERVRDNFSLEKHLTTLSRNIEASLKENH